jgi:sucrose-6-phosphate hydrolase SacC (GH32 family)
MPFELLVHVTHNRVTDAGPFLLDLGDALYAPNCFRDGSGRRLMLGWFQELGARGPSADFTYSGCLTLPRVLSRRGEAV